MKPFNVPNIIPASTRMNTTINSTAIAVYNNYVYSIEIVFTGTPTGVFKLQFSNDPAFSGIPGQPLSTDWTDVPTAGQFTVSAAGSVMWNHPWPGFNWVRAVYTDSSGGASTAIITKAIFNGKGQ